MNSDRTYLFNEVLSARSVCRKGFGDAFDEEPIEVIDTARSRSVSPPIINGGSNSSTDADTTVLRPVARNDTP